MNESDDIDSIQEKMNYLYRKNAFLTKRLEEVLLFNGSESEAHNDSSMSYVGSDVVNIERVEIEVRIEMKSIRDALLETDSEEFIKKIYQIIIGRDADSSGVEHYMFCLANKKNYTRIDVLSDLLFSVEMSQFYPELARYRFKRKSILVL